MEEYITYMNSPVGWLEIAGDENGVKRVYFVDEQGKDSETVPDTLVQCSKQLQDFFDGKRKSFDLKLNPQGTAFQLLVWSELQQIPFGDTVSYGSIARKLKDEKLTRAVGHANGQNPIAVIIPCHRVIGENGKLTGYAGGMWRKSWLLDHEGKVSGKNLKLF